MTAYTDATKIAAYLGLTLTGAQQTQAGVLAQAASDWIDEYKGRSWQDASPITDEIQTIVGDRVYLTNRPVATVTSVKTRTYYPDLGSTTLADDEYELLDGANGLLLIKGWSASDVIALVTYTYTAEPPSHIALAATMIAASWLAPTLAPQTAGLDSVAVGQNDVTVKFRKDRGDVPAEALTLLGARPVAIA